MLSREGKPSGTFDDPINFCAALKRKLGETRNEDALKAIWAHNAASIEMLQQNLPDLKTEAGQHFSAILGSLYQRRLQEIREGSQHPDKLAEHKTRPAIDKAALTISEPKRVRDKDYLRYVASLPCLVCGRRPTQAHHLRFAQPRALGRKVSNEWSVPLCLTHHRALHDSGDEESWWQERHLDPIDVARRLWREAKAGIAK